MNGPKLFLTFNQFDKTIRDSGRTYSRDKYLSLPESERQALFEVSKLFMAACKNMGPASAIELACNLGSWMNCNPTCNTPTPAA